MKIIIVLMLSIAGLFASDINLGGTNSNKIYLGNTYNIKLTDNFNKFKIALWDANEGKEILLTNEIISDKFIWNVRSDLDISHKYKLKIYNLNENTVSISDDFFKIFKSNISKINENNLNYDKYNSSLSPNPVNDIATLSLDLLEESIVSAELYDINGNQLLSIVNSQRLALGSNSLAINTSNLSSGLYFVKITIGSEVITKELVVSK